VIAQLCASEDLKRESIRSRQVKLCRNQAAPASRVTAGIDPASDSPNRTRTSGLPRVMAWHLIKEAANSGGL
jgi:hypothetical protein